MNAPAKSTPPAAAPKAGAAVTVAAPSLVAKFAAKFQVDADKMMTTFRKTIFPSVKADGGGYREATNEEVMALLIVADQYNLNPFTKEIYAFPDERRGIIPIVSVDGWLRILNEREELTSITFEYGNDGDAEKSDVWCQCTITRSDRTEPVAVREYLNECKRNTGPWSSHPRRMLRHKAIIQCGRIAFGFAGIYDPDEAERIYEASIQPTKKPPTEPPRERLPAPAAAATDKPAEPGPAPAIGAATKDELRKVLDATGISESAVCEKFAVASLDELSEEGVKLAIHWAKNVNG